MNILLVNDDGFQSESLALLCRAAAARGHRVTVCAPSVQQSGKAHSFTIFTPVMAHKREMDGAAAAYMIDGTPVDCARLGFMELCGGTPDLVMSGINFGYNTGLATYVSGTVGAAREAAFHHLPAMAVSMHEETPDATQRFYADWLITLAEYYVQQKVPPMAVLNVNVPPVAVHELKEPVMCGIDQEVYRDGYERRESPRGGEYFWQKEMQFGVDATPGSDDDMLRKGHITCTLLTPVPCDQMKYADFLKDL